MRRNANIATASVALAFFAWSIAGPSAIGAVPTAPWTPTATLAAYTLVTPTSEVPSGLLARAVIPAGAGCPLLTGTYAQATTGTMKADFSYQMRLRAKPELAGSAYAAVDVCERGLPSNTQTAMVGNTVTPATLPARIDRIAILGDTGCRITSWEVQNCSNTSAWPTARISRNIAKSRPDVIIHLGDYFYREAACPAAEQALCASSPPPPGNLPETGSDYGWIADALLPMQPLFDAAPLLLLRGNHESCSRGGIGYFLFFSPQLSTALQCAPSIANGVVTVPSNDITPTWHTTWNVGTSAATARSLDLEIIDSAYGNDIVVDSYAQMQRASYVEAAAHVLKTRPDEAWLLTHRPIFAVVTTEFTNGGSVWSSADQTAASQGLLGGYNLLLSSHIHVNQVVTIPGQPSQLMLGNGGTYLDPATGYQTPNYGPLSKPDGTPSSTLATPYPAPTNTWTDTRFGFVIATPGNANGNWSIAQRDQRGKLFARCALAKRTMSCQSAN